MYMFNLLILVGVIGALAALLILGLVLLVKKRIEKAVPLNPSGSTEADDTIIPGMLH